MEAERAVARRQARLEAKRQQENAKLRYSEGILSHYCLLVIARADFTRDHVVRARPAAATTSATWYPRAAGATATRATHSSGCAGVSAARGLGQVGAAPSGRSAGPYWDIEARSYLIPT